VVEEGGRNRLEADLTSDTAAMNGMIAGLLAATAGVRAMRDATRGGVATILNEVATAAGVSVVVSEDQIPVRTQVRGAAELLGIDPMYVASEGRLVAIVEGGEADRALAALRAHPLGEQAAIIGHIAADPPAPDTAPIPLAPAYHDHAVSAGRWRTQVTTYARLRARQLCGAARPG
jgi:hydrogenase expression/formation protein HypE